MTTTFWIQAVALVLVMAGSLNWGLVGAFNWNLVASLTQAIRVPGLARVVYVLVGVAALVHLFRRDFYLPFLGQSVYPCGSLTPKRPLGADVSVTIQTLPNANVIYWASEPNQQAAVVENPWLAYDQYANAGVARSDATGAATLHVRRPSAYKVPAFKGGKVLAPHVHYRVCKQPGMLGAVETVAV